MVVARLWVALTLAMGVPINMHVTRVSISLYFPVKSKNSLPVHVLSTSLILVTSVIMAVMVPDAVSYFKFIGASLSIIIGKVLPTMIYFKISENPSKRTALTIWTLLFALIGAGSILSSLIIN